MYLLCFGGNNKVLITGSEIRDVGGLWYLDVMWFRITSKHLLNDQLYKIKFFHPLRKHNVPLYQALFLTCSQTSDKIKNSGNVTTWILLTEFRKILVYQITWKSIQWGVELLHAVVKTDMTEIVVAFRISARSPWKLKSQIPFFLDQRNLNTKQKVFM
jgi:hypothetical protein